MIVVLDNLRSAYNVGSIIRTCDALGIKDIFFCGITPDPDNPKVKKTSLGAEKSIKPTIFLSTAEATGYLIKNKINILALEVAGGSIMLEDIEVKKPFALVVGNEVSGVSEDVIKVSSQIIEIPMKGQKESLNVSVAFGIAAYELSKSLTRN